MITKTTILIEGNPIPVDRLVATYTPRHNLRTPPTLLLEWDSANLFFTGEKALTTLLILRAHQVPFETILQVSHA